MGTYEQELHEHISMLEHGLRRHKNNPAPTVPIYDLNAVPPFLVDVDSWVAQIYLDGVLQDSMDFYWVRFIPGDDATSRAGDFDPGHQPHPSTFDVTRTNTLLLTGWKPATQNGWRYGTTIQDHSGINNALSGYSVFGSWSFTTDAHSNEFFGNFSQINIPFDALSNFYDGAASWGIFGFQKDYTFKNATAWGVAVHCGDDSGGQIIFQFDFLAIPAINPGISGLTVSGNYTHTVHSNPSGFFNVHDHASGLFSTIKILVQFFGTNRVAYDADPVVMLGL